MPSFKGNAHTQAHEILSQKTRDLGEDYVILACTVLIQLTSVTDRQPDTQAMAKTREALKVTILCKRLNSKHYSSKMLDMINSSTQQLLHTTSQTNAARPEPPLPAPGTGKANAKSRKKCWMLQIC